MSKRKASPAVQNEDSLPRNSAPEGYGLHTGITSNLANLMGNGSDSEMLMAKGSIPNGAQKHYLRHSVGDISSYRHARPQENISELSLTTKRVKVDSFIDNTSEEIQPEKLLPSSPEPGSLPDPARIFESLFARDTTPKENAQNTSSMLFYLATIIFHDVFYTDETSDATDETFSSLNLTPLYGSNEDQQKRVRLFEDGLLKFDTFSDARILTYPPGVSALLVLFNRFHNYIVMQLKIINEGGRFTVPASQDDVEGIAKLDEDLFQTARSVTCGLYVNIILTDYARTFLDLESTNLSDININGNDEPPTAATANTSGSNYRVSAEASLAYRWYSAASRYDEEWTTDFWTTLLPQREVANISEHDYLSVLHEWLGGQDPDPARWELGNGQYTRAENGRVRDEDLVKILTESTEDIAGALGPRNVPRILRTSEIMNIKQARKWEVTTLNDFRRFMNLAPYQSFSDITRDAGAADALQSLYGHPDNVELYPGLVAEDTTVVQPSTARLQFRRTISSVVLADATTLSKGTADRSADSSTAILTKWGSNQIKSDPEVAQGGCIYNLIMRGLPNWYRGYSVYALFPFTTPGQTKEKLTKMGLISDYLFQRPSFQAIPTSVRTWQGTTSVLMDQKIFRVPWRDHITSLSGHDYMLAGDEAQNRAEKKEVANDLYCPINGLDKVRHFYEALTTQLVEIRSLRLGGDWFQLDACRDVANPSHTVFMAQIFNLPLKAPGEWKVAAEVDELYLAMSVIFTYVFLDSDCARSFKLRAGARVAAAKIEKLMTVVCQAAKAGSYLQIDRIFHASHSDRILAEYGSRMLRRMFDNGQSVADVVWNMIPTAAGGVATQAQHFTQMLDLYLSPEYNKHWRAIQKCAWSDTPEDFEKLKSYALEANRLAPAAFGLLRDANEGCTIQDGDLGAVPVTAGQTIYADFVTAGLDANVFPDPEEIKLDRDRSLYIHHGYGPHSCLGRPFVEVAMAAQLKVFAKLKNLRRAPGRQGELLKTIPLPNPVCCEPQPNPGSVGVFLKEDYSDWWPFPMRLKVRHDGFYVSQDEYLSEETGLPNLEKQIAESKERNHTA